MYAGFAAAGIGAAASLDNTIKDTVQAHRTTGQDQFFNQYQNLGAAWSLGVIGAFEIWGEVGGNTTAKNTAMDAYLRYGEGEVYRCLAVEKRGPNHFGRWFGGGRGLWTGKTHFMKCNRVFSGMVRSFSAAILWRNRRNARYFLPLGADCGREFIHLFEKHREFPDLLFLPRGGKARHRREADSMLHFPK
jgi:hypothetical protein